MPTRFIRRSKQGAFTFIEMIVVTVMVGIVSLAIYSTLNNGLKIWQKVSQPLPAEDPDIFLEKFTADIGNSFAFSGIDHKGSEDSWEFATLVSSNKLQSRTVGKISYSYDRNDKVLRRAQNDYSQVYSGDDDAGVPVLSNVRSCKFQYYDYEPLTQEYVWKDEWQKKILPLAVRIELEIVYENQVSKFTKTVSIPVSG